MTKMQLGDRTDSTLSNIPSDIRLNHETHRLRYTNEDLNYNEFMEKSAKTLVELFEPFRLCKGLIPHDILTKKLNTKYSHDNLLRFDRLYQLYCGDKLDTIKATFEERECDTLEELFDMINDIDMHIDQTMHLLNNERQRELTRMRLFIDFLNIFNVVDPKQEDEEDMEEGIEDDIYTIIEHINKIAAENGQYSDRVLNYLSKEVDFVDINNDQLLELISYIQENYTDAHAAINFLKDLLDE